MDGSRRVTFSGGAPDKIELRSVTES
jgi:hypothetical protein